MGVVQLVAAVLLVTQRFALAGALLVLPVITAIAVFCWSTAVYPTATVATLMWLGTALLVLWELPRWRGVIAPGPAPAPPAAAPLELRVWRGGGVAILVLYAVACALDGGVYRPRGGAAATPAFFALALVPLVPFVTFAVERVRARRRPGAAGRAG